MSAVRKLSAAAFALLPVGCALIVRIISIPVAFVVWVGALCSWILVGDGSVSLDEELRASGVRIERRVVEIEVDDDLTFAGTLEETKLITSASGLADAQFQTIPFNPETQTLELESAHVEMPDGTRVEVADDQVVTGPSRAALGAPEFVTSSAVTVIFPQLRVGARTSVRWKFEERGTSPFGFNFCWRPALTLPLDESVIRIRCAAGAALRHAERGGFVVADTVEGDRRRLEATLRGWPGYPAERSMVSPRDVCPLFEATTLATWEEIGARFHEAVAGRIEVTPEIDALAAKLAGGKSGVDAARAIHRWVAANVRYVKVYLQQMDGWVPHAAGDVLRNGYGDCKDQVVLLASLLRARGIACEPVLVDFERAYQPLPLCTPLQFNHCMAYLPELDLWSNPTSPWLDLGTLDLALSGKMVLVADAKGRIARTPAGSADVNTVRSVHAITLTKEGRIEGTSTIEVGGRPAGVLREFLVNSGDADRAADDLMFESATFASGQLSSSDPADLSIPLRCEGRFAEEARVAMGPTLHFTIPSGLEAANLTRLRRLYDGAERRFPLVAGAVSVSSTRTIRLPERYAFAPPPAGRELRNAVASYQLTFALASPAELRVETRLRLEKDVVSPAEYRELESVLQAVAEDLRTILVAESDGTASPR